MIRIMVRGFGVPRCPSLITFPDAGENINVEVTSDSITAMTYVKNYVASEEGAISTGFAAAVGSIGGLTVAGGAFLVSGS
jgi:hypothetical protein